MRLYSFDDISPFASWKSIEFNMSLLRIQIVPSFDSAVAFSDSTLTSLMTFAVLMDICFISRDTSAYLASALSSIFSLVHIMNQQMRKSHMVETNNTWNIVGMLHLLLPLFERPFPEFMFRTEPAPA